MKVLIVVGLMFISMTVSAGCRLDGVEYPVGAVVDGYECGSDGQWTPR